ncbi:hypothetical protein [Nocardia caishijiensis]|uniref:Uncharacterized protein n=1 Tax=Nocardia caishijiensis TaxID=184756 RepID=A0ABQ6YJ57_9NOCA|nr:hypothetical protein [Nocardia caishijiensis]KAF0845751.1 hypothetical protein FNL39_106139 [Nocardia caishijiensis]
MTITPERDAAGEAVDYAEMLHALAEASVERGFSPYHDIDWDATEFQVAPTGRPRGFAVNRSMNLRPTCQLISIRRS